ncbi:hypothetical protein LCGC14_0549790 [marine sediment metagenome]|uniref:AAA+ ATPase domain-containing protein n=1 Tax=marine sediment metagenome TaxID=412755 RepID=A0A0F9S8S4_9ZZZZ
MTEKETSSLSGQLSYIVFSNEENGFFIGTLTTKNNEESKFKNKVTITGAAINGIPEIKSELKLHGEWTIHAKYGEQFKFSVIVEDFEVSKEGQQKFLMNYVKGLGPVKTKHIIDEFRENTFKVIREAPEELLKFDIPEETVEAMKRALEEHGADADAIAVLSSYEITTGAIKKLMEVYRSANKTVQVIQENPYQLIKDIDGFGFLKSDKIARQLGYDINSPNRIQAAVAHVLYEASNRGHTYITRQKLVWGAGKYEKGMRDYLGAQVLEDDMDTAILELHTQDEVFILFDNYQNEIKAKSQVSLKSLYNAERQIERTTINLVNTKEEPKEVEIDEILNLDQASAVKQVFNGESAICVITGGAGVGKTFVTKEILRLAQLNKLTVQLLSPTGKAVKRLEEMTGRSASTIHRYLKYNPHEGGFTLEEVWHDVLIIDEASMVDSVLMNELLKRLDESRTKLILVGDKNQLPPVGAGRPFQDIIESDFFPVFTLNKIMRTDDDSLIPLNAGRILSGNNYDIEFDAKQMSMIDERTAEDIPQLIVREIMEDTNYLPEEIQVLTPQKKGPIGTGELNEVLRNALNREGVELSKFKGFSVGDKIILIHNNYDQNYMNGDQGYIKGEDLTKVKRPIMNVELEGGQMIEIDKDTIYDVQHAYAITIHKSQGSEWKKVILLVHPAHSFMLSRNLIYTGITRGRYNVTLAGTQFGLKVACEKSGMQERFTWLSDFYQEYGVEEEEGGE